MSNLIFDSWHQWKVCFSSGCSKAAWGIWRIVTCIILGIVSVFAYIGRQIEAFTRREPVAMLIVTILIVCMSLGWLFTFTSGRVALKSAQYERDSMSIRLSRYLQAYDDKQIVVIDKDTIQ